MKPITRDANGTGWVQGGKPLNDWVAAAVLIREELKAAFPGIKFSVRSECNSGSDSVYISWVDGPRVADVEAIVGKYEYGSYNGQIDMYEHSNVREDVPQVRFVQTGRGRSNEATVAIVERVNADHGWNLQLREMSNGDMWVHPDSDKFIYGEGRQSDWIHRYHYQTSYICAECKTIAEATDAFCAQCGYGLQGEVRRY